MTLPGPSKTIVVEPIERPTRAPEPGPETPEPEPQRSASRPEQPSSDRPSAKEPA